MYNYGNAKVLNCSRKFSANVERRNYVSTKICVKRVFLKFQEARGVLEYFRNILKFFDISME